MLKVAVLGANGQVGAELCLLLARQPGIELVPVSRNRSGSAFLRWCGIACRHGRPADPNEGRRLIADCDVIVNSALASGTPREIRKIEDQLVENAFARSKPGAIVIHFSTQNVYGDPDPKARVRTLSPYGRAKLGTERAVRRAARRWHKRAFILRLGHVTGELQNISNLIRANIAGDSVVLPDTDADSNTVFTVTIVDAIMSIARGNEIPGTYDLMNLPQWTWRQVYEYEAGICAASLNPTFVSRPNVSSPLIARAGTLNGIKNAATSIGIRHFAAKLLAHAPERLSQRGQAWWYVRRARQEIAAVQPTSVAQDHLFWISNGRHFLTSLKPTAELLQTQPYQNLTRTGISPWPLDLPDAIADRHVEREPVVPSSDTLR